MGAIFQNHYDDEFNKVKEEIDQKFEEKKEEIINQKSKELKIEKEKLEQMNQISQLQLQNKLQTEFDLKLDQLRERYQEKEDREKE